MWKLIRNANFGDGGGGDGGGGSSGGGGGDTGGDPGSSAGGGGDPGAGASGDPGTGDPGAAAAAVAAAQADAAAGAAPTAGGVGDTGLGVSGTAPTTASAADALGVGTDEAGGRSGIPATTPSSDADRGFAASLANTIAAVSPDTLSGAAPPPTGGFGLTFSGPVSTDPSVLAAAGLGNVPGFPIGAGGAGGGPTAALGSLGDTTPLAPTSVSGVPGSQAPSAGDIAAIGQPAPTNATFAGYNTTGLAELGNAALTGAVVGSQAPGVDLGTVGQPAASTPTGAGTGQSPGDLNALQAGSLADIGLSAPAPSLDASALAPVSMVTQGGGLTGGVAPADVGAFNDADFFGQMFSQIGGVPQVPGSVGPVTTPAGAPAPTNTGAPGPDPATEPLLGPITFDMSQPPPDPAASAALGGPLAGALGPGGALGRVLSPGFPGFPGAPGGVELAGGNIQLPNGVTLTSDQVAALVQQQDALLLQWEKVIPPGDPRWPQVEAMVQKQIWQDSGQPGGVELAP